MTEIPWEWGKEEPVIEDEGKTYDNVTDLLDDELTFLVNLLINEKMKKQSQDDKPSPLT